MQCLRNTLTTAISDAVFDILCKNKILLVIITFSDCTFPSSQSLSSCSRLHPVKVKVEKVGHMLNFSKLAIFGIVDSNFSGSAKIDFSLVIALQRIFEFPLDTYAAESS